MSGWRPRPWTAWTAARDVVELGCGLRSSPAGHHECEGLHQPVLDARPEGDTATLQHGLVAGQDRRPRGAYVLVGHRLVRELRVHDGHPHSRGGLGQGPRHEGGIFIDRREPKGVGEAVRRLELDHLADDEDSLPILAPVEQAAAPVEVGLEDRVEHGLLDALTPSDLSPDSLERRLDRDRVREVSRGPGCGSHRWRDPSIYSSLRFASRDAEAEARDAPAASTFRASLRHRRDPRSCRCRCRSRWRLWRRASFAITT